MRNTPGPKHPARPPTSTSDCDSHVASGRAPGVCLSVFSGVFETPPMPVSRGATHSECLCTPHRASGPGAQARTARAVVPRDCSNSAATRSSSLSWLKCLKHFSATQQATAGRSESVHRHAVSMHSLCCSLPALLPVRQEREQPGSCYALQCTTTHLQGLLTCAAGYRGWTALQGCLLPPSLRLGPWR